jgi:hypothetical protein
MTEMSGLQVNIEVAEETGFRKNRNRRRNEIPEDVRNVHSRTVVMGTRRNRNHVTTQGNRGTSNHNGFYIDENVIKRIVRTIHEQFQQQPCQLLNSNRGIEAMEIDNEDNNVHRHGNRQNIDTPNQLQHNHEQKLTKEERQHRMTTGACLNCGRQGHINRDCYRKSDSRNTMTQIVSNRLTHEEHKHRRQMGACLNCGKQGHVKDECRSK